MKTSEDNFFDSLVEEKTAEEKAPEPVSESSTPVSAKPITQKNLFSNPETHPLVLDLALLKFLGMEWFSWLSDTLFYEIENTFSTSVADVNRLKILASQTLHVADSFWHQWEVFEKTVLTLNGVVPIPELMQPPDLALLLAGVDIANQIRKEEFENEIARYCAAVFLYEDVQYAPEPLEFCQPYITQPMYECKDCGKKGSALPPFDELCTSCAGHFLTEQPLSYVPDPEALKRGAGRNLVLSKTYNPEPVKARFEALNKLSNPSKDIRETAEDIAAARLIIAVDYKNYRAQQLREQLGSLRGWLESA